MGEIFFACAYDVEAKTCCTVYADKFHANCYSFSNAVISMHYLLRQAPYHVLWGGDGIVEDFSDISSKELLLGLSTYLGKGYFSLNSSNLKNEEAHDKVKFIDENHKLWKHIHVEDEAVEYFDYENTNSVKYTDYLVNHTKKLAIDLADYYEKSRSFRSDQGIIQEMAMDPVPVLTETGGGSYSVFMEGITADTTEKLACTWRGDLLQITDAPPDGYELIHCCFAEVKERAFFSYQTFGVNKDGLLLNDNNGTLFSGVRLDLFFGKRGLPCHIKAEKNGTNIRFKPVAV